MLDADIHTQAHFDTATSEVIAEHRDVLLVPKYRVDQQQQTA